MAATGAVLDLLVPTSSVTVNHAVSTTVDHLVLSEDGVNWTDLGGYTLSGAVPFTSADNSGNNVDISVIKQLLLPVSVGVRSMATLVFWS